MVSQSRCDEGDTEQKTISDRHYIVNSKLREIIEMERSFNKPLAFACNGSVRNS